MTSFDRQILKFTLIGDPGVGKTSILKQFYNKEFTNQYEPTIGSDFASKQLYIDDKYIVLQIWDTEGHERFQSLGPSFYRGSDCCILVYNVTRPVSFENIKTWKNKFSIELNLSNDNNFPFMLLGNKSDLPEKEVQESTAREYASKNGNMLFYEVSSKTGENIQEAFEAAVKQVIKNLTNDNSKQESKPKGFFQKLFSKNTEKIEPKDDKDTDRKLQSELAKQKQELEMQLANKNKEIESLKEKHESKIKELEMQLANKNKEIESLKEKHESNLKEFEMQLANKNKEIECKNDDLKKMQNQIDSMKHEHDEEIQRMKERNKKDQKESPQSNLKNKSIEILDFDIINELEKIDKIGDGSSGEIYKVVKKEIYALKVMKIAGKSYKDFQMFFNEYEIINILNHLNILKTYGIFLSNENTPPSFLLEFCPMNLDKAIKTKMFTNCQIVFAIYQIAEGMRYVHFQKIIHRDLKPTNILVAEDGTIKIGDFGISKLMSAEEQSMTIGIGTQKFMAPEIINEEDYDEKVDVYSFGVIVYFIISGGEMPNNKIRDICLGKKADIPPSFTQFAKDLINKCWEFDPKKRPSFSKICDDIEKSNFNLLDLKEIEIKEVEMMVNKLKDKIPPY